MQCFSFSFLNTNHNLNQFLHASLSTLKWHILGTKFTNLSLSCAQSCVTTYWYHVWYLLWLMIIYAWLSTTQKQVDKILMLPKSIIFLPCAQWTVLICMIFMDFVTEWVKKLLHSLPWWKLCICRIGSKLHFRHGDSEFSIG